MVNKIILGVDAGLDGVKVVGADGEIRFPSHLYKLPRQERHFGDSFESKDQFIVEFEGRRYVLGEHAELYMNANNMLSGHGGTGSKNDNKAFIRAFGGICKYLEQSKQLGETDFEIQMAYGSPIDSIAEAESTDVEEIQSFYYNGGKPFEIKYNGKLVRLYIQDVIVLPEGMTAFFAEEFDEETVYIVDAGSQTVNLAALRQGTPLPNETKTMTEGVEYYRNLYKEDLAEELAEAVRAEMDNLRWPRNAPVHVCGGFSRELADELGRMRGHKRQMNLIRPAMPRPGRKSPRRIDPVFANAAGLFFIAKEAFAEEVKG